MSDLTEPRFTDIKAAYEYLESIRWPGGPVCPHCFSIKASTRIQGKSARPGLWSCSKCRKQFTVTVGTVFERSHIPLHKWLLANHLICASKKGISAHQLHRMLGVTYKTAWFMAHRIREAMKDAKPSPMGGGGRMVEVDETFLGKQPIIYTADGGFHKKTGTAGLKKIVALVERGGRARTVKVDNITASILREVVFKNVQRSSVLQTDEAGYYRKMGKEFADHQTVNHSKYEYARGTATTNTVEGYFSIFKRGMKGVYQHCSEAHLHRYLAEFDFRYNSSRSAIVSAPTSP